MSDLTSMHIWNMFSLVPHFSDPQSELEGQNSRLSAHASRQLPVIKYPKQPLTFDNQILIHLANANTCCFMNSNPIVDSMKEICVPSVSSVNHFEYDLRF